MKVVSIAHPDSAYPDAIEAVCLKLAKDYRLHSTVYLPSQIQGSGNLMLFFEPRPKLRVIEFKGKSNENEKQ